MDIQFIIGKLRERGGGALKNTIGGRTSLARRRELIRMRLDDALGYFVMFVACLCRADERRRALALGPGDDAQGRGDHMSGTRSTNPDSRLKQGCRVNIGERGL